MAKPYYVIGNRLRQSDPECCAAPRCPLHGTTEPKKSTHNGSCQTCKHLMRPPPTRTFCFIFRHIVTHSVNEVVGEAEKAALVAIDHVLATQKDETSEKNVFNELEGVDKAVATACSGVIRALLQVCFVALLLIDRCLLYTSPSPRD